MSRKQIVTFIVALLAVSWTAQFLILHFIGGPDSASAAPFIVAVMFFPGLLGLGFTLLSRRVRATVQWKPRGVLAILVSMILPIGLAFIAIALLTVSGLGKSDYFQFGVTSVEILSGPWALGTGQQLWPVFVANVLVTTAMYATMTGLATIGEEYGWRGVLQNSMIREFGFGGGVALLGIVWALWHFPVILAGYNYPESPVLGAIVFMPLLLISASYVMAWLTLWSGSFWPAVFMHGAINSVYDSLFTKVTLSEPSSYTMPLIEIGLFALLAGAASIWAKRFALDSM